MSLRNRSALARRDADMLDACAEHQEALEEAKAAYGADPCGETAQARRDAMAKMFTFRRFVRSVARVVRLRSDLARGAYTDPMERRAAELELERLEPEYGPFANGHSTPAGPGDTEARPKTARGRARTNPAGGA